MRWIAMFLSLAGCATTPPAANDMIVYVGTYTENIHRFRLDGATGALTPAGASAGVKNPSFLAIHPSRRFLYAVGEVGEFAGKKTGAVGAFAIHPETGDLTPLNQQSSEGSGPCHLVVDAPGKNVLVANYGGGSVAALPIGADGRLGPATSSIQHKGSGANPKRQAGPHAHSINLDADGRFAFAADLGLDKILIYRFDAKTGVLAPHEEAAVAPGSGPRHFSFHPGGRFAYVINEMTCTVTAFEFDRTGGRLTRMQDISTLPEGEPVKPGYSTAEVQAHPSGKFLYGSNRGHDTIAIFAVDAATGKLTAAGHASTRGKTPRNFGIDPTGRWLLAANQGSDTITVFRIDPKTGGLEFSGHTAQVPKPVCVKFVTKGF